MVIHPLLSHTTHATGTSVVRKQQTATHQQQQVSNCPNRESCKQEGWEDTRYTCRRWCTHCLGQPPVPTVTLTPLPFSLFVLFGRMCICVCACKHNCTRPRAGACAHVCVCVCVCVLCVCVSACACVRARMHACICV